MTKAEAVVWRRLRELNKRGFKFRRQHPIGEFVADFATVRARLVIEIDGATHSSESERAYDRWREDFLISQGWRVVRFTNDAVYRDVDAVVEEIIGRLPLT